MIAVPFVGSVKVAGLSPMEVQALIERRLHGKAIRPQVLVSVVTNVTNVVTLAGAVKEQGRFSLTPASETLLQMIAIAGGATALESDTIVQLTRDKRQVSFRLSDLASAPGDDIHAWPGDYLNLILDPRIVLVSGAVGKSDIYPLEVDDRTLAQVISHAGGLRDLQADSRGVFLFRYEFSSVLSAIPKERIVAAPPANAADATGALVPVIYKVDLKTAAGIFYSTRLMLRDRDLVFVPTARSVDWEKYLDLLRMTAAPVTEGTTSGVEMDRAY
jgi:polysaccharide biosynthesis/export protein